MDEEMSTPPLTPSRSPTPNPAQPPIVQPDHFYGADENTIIRPPSPSSSGRDWLTPSEDPNAARGIPVFKPSMEEFADFEKYMISIEPWGMRSGIVKVIPPAEWKGKMPGAVDGLRDVKVKRPIEQNMIGSGGKFRQENIEKRKQMSVREWVELTRKDEFKAPTAAEVGLFGRGATNGTPPKKKKTRAASKVEEGQVVKDEPEVDGLPDSTPAGKQKKVRTKETREADAAEKAKLDREFLDSFEPETSWLPDGMTPEDYTPEFCKALERTYWRNCGLGKAPWYGADSQGSLYTDSITSWNVAHLPSTLSRLLPSSSQGLPGVNTPYLYFGMWRATFAWHVEDMDLFSINYVHFGAPKFWYAVPQSQAPRLESTMKSFFPTDPSLCPEFLRHKSYLVSPSVLSKSSSVKPNWLVQHAGEFVITYPKGYHAGFNLGLNCAESVNFALDSWLEVGRRAKACQCVGDSVRINVDQLLADRAAEKEAAENPQPRPNGDVLQLGPTNDDFIMPTDVTSSGRKRKPTAKTRAEDEDSAGSGSKKRKSLDSDSHGPSAAKKAKTASTSAPAAPGPKVTLKLPAPGSGVGASAGFSKWKKQSPGHEHNGDAPLPCCLCPSLKNTRENPLLRVVDPPRGKSGVWEGTERNLCVYDQEGEWQGITCWRAHELCARVVPETWVDEIPSGNGQSEKVVFGVDGIVRDRWNLKCSVCTKPRLKGHGAPVQCVKGKCPKAFHVSCAKESMQLNDGEEIVFEVIREVEKEVVLVESGATATAAAAAAAATSSAPSTTTNHGLVKREGEDESRMDIDITSSAPAASTSSGQATTDSAASRSAQEAYFAAAAANKLQEQKWRKEDGARVLKTIRKDEVKVLCLVHNPLKAKKRKNDKESRLRETLLRLPYMSRIKVRMSSGTFEVSLLRVDEQRGIVEVLWDQPAPPGTNGEQGGMVQGKREIKWGSVLLGSLGQGPGSDIIQYQPSQQQQYQVQQGQAVPLPARPDQQQYSPPPPPPNYSHAHAPGPAHPHGSQHPQQHYPPPQQYHSPPPMHAPMPTPAPRAQPPPTGYSYPHHPSPSYSPYIPPAYYPYSYPYPQYGATPPGPVPAPPPAALGHPGYYGLPQQAMYGHPAYPVATQHVLPQATPPLVPESSQAGKQNDGQMDQEPPAIVKEYLASAPESVGTAYREAREAYEREVEARRRQEQEHIGRGGMEVEGDKDRPGSSSSESEEGPKTPPPPAVPSTAADPAAEVGGGESGMAPMPKQDGMAGMAAALASLDASQIAEMIKENPGLRERLSSVLGSAMPS